MKTLPGVRPAERAVPISTLPVAKRGRELLADGLLNKDTAFSPEEREAFGLHGLLPARTLSIEEQERLELERVRRKADDLERYIGLAALQDRNETLFHRLLRDNLDELLSIVYTPTVGRACQEFSHILRRPRGLWLTPADIDHIPQLLRSAGGDDVRLIVVTDNERILGLGDQGAGGIGIPIGKLAIYGAVAGIRPSWTLPISLDVGTDHPGLLADPLYVGHPAPRLRGESYDAFIEAFVAGVRHALPQAVLQWEDFKGANALRLLERYRHRLPSFNDDIQGTAATALGGLLAGKRLLRGRLGEQRYLLVGAGGAGIGIARLLCRALVEEGLAPADAARRLALVDREGLVHDGRGLSPEKSDFALPADLLPEDLRAQRPGGGYALAPIIDFWRPTVLIGTTGTAGSFDEPAITTMARISDRPLIMALSNPTSACEAPPERLLEWSEARAIVSTGSPFPPVELGGHSHVIGQANNALIFPGLGLGAIVAEASEITDGMLLAAAATLAEQVTPARLASGAIYPPVAELPLIARQVALAVVRVAREEGVGRQLNDEQIEQALDRAIWVPDYLPYVAAEPGGAGASSTPV